MVDADTTPPTQASETSGTPSTTTAPFTFTSTIVVVSRLHSHKKFSTRWTI